MKLNLSSLFKFKSKNGKMSKIQLTPHERFFIFPAGKDDAEFFIKELEQRLREIFSKSNRQESDLAERILDAIKEKIEARKYSKKTENKASMNLSNLQGVGCFGPGLDPVTYNKVCDTIEKEISEIFNVFNTSIEV